ncbi:MAG: DUF4229 domain-containing protein [Stackebrandtia sp.]
MSPALKYLLARIGLFVVVGAALLATGLNPLVCAMTALLVSFVLSFVLFKKWRREMIRSMDETMSRRREEKARLRKALAGDED